MPQGGLRTFLPGVQPGDLIDARRWGRRETLAWLRRGAGTFPPGAGTIANAARYAMGQQADKELPRPTK